VNADFTVATIPDIDHWMWVCTRSHLSLKTMRRDAVLAQVLDLITNWIQRH
jgi:hypothetical protein